MNSIVLKVIVLLHVLNLFLKKCPRSLDHFSQYRLSGTTSWTYSILRIYKNGQDFLYIQYVVDVFECDHYQGVTFDDLKQQLHIFSTKQKSLIVSNMRVDTIYETPCKCFCRRNILSIQNIWIYIYIRLNSIYIAYIYHIYDI